MGERAARRIVLEVQPSELFDKLAGNRDLQEALGSRLVGALLAPVGFIDAVGLAFYGITISDEPASLQQQGEER